MLIDSAFWRDLEAQFRALPDSIRLTATLFDRQWELTDGPRGTKARERLHEMYRLLAEKAGKAGGAPAGADTFTYWHNLVKEKSYAEVPADDGEGTVDRPHFRLMLAGNSAVGHIQNLAVASADCCAILAQQKHEAAAPTRLWREQYPLYGFLCDNSHDPRPDSKTKLDYARVKVWGGYYAKIENLKSRRTEVDYRQRTLGFAVTCLSYDLAVLQANYVIDRGLRGDEAAHAYRDEAASLLEEVSSSRRANCERLGVSFEDDTEGLKDLAQAFHQVRDDFQRLLAGLPTAPAAEADRQAAYERMPASAAPASRVTTSVPINGVRMREFRDEEKLTQEKLAEYGGMSVSHISRAERLNHTWKLSTLDDFVGKLTKRGYKITVEELRLDRSPSLQNPSNPSKF
jgi:hypothetical protein